MTGSEEAARQLKELLQAQQQAGRSPADLQVLDRQLTRLTQMCSLCHQSFRDAPQEDK